MKIRLFLDEDAMSKALVQRLPARGADAVTALEEGTVQYSDEDQLDHAHQRGRVLYSFNVGDFCRLHQEYVQKNKSHSGIVVAQQDQFSVGEQIRRLLNLINKVTENSMKSRLEFLSAW